MGRGSRPDAQPADRADLSPVLADTSVWVELLRRTESPAHLALRQQLATLPGHVALTEPVVMELLSGTRPRDLPALEQLIDGHTVLAVQPRDFTDAARAYRAARESGRTVRSLVDCLIAVIAARTGAELWHRDADFDVLAEILADLRVRSLL